MSLYNFERRLFLAVDGPSGIKQSQKVSKENKKTLLEFATYIKATGKGLSRQVKLLLTLKRLAELREISLLPARTACTLLTNPGCLSQREPFRMKRSNAHNASAHKKKKRNI